MVGGKGGLYGLRRVGRTFGGLGQKFQPDGYSVSNIFEDSFAEEGTGLGTDIFEGLFNFVAFE